MTIGGRHTALVPPDDLIDVHGVRVVLPTRPQRGVGRVVREELAHLENLHAEELACVYTVQCVRYNVASVSLPADHACIYYTHAFPVKL